MFTVGGIEAIDWALDVSATTVGLLGARDTVTRRVPGVPLGSVSVAGASEVTTGGGGVTVTAVAAVGPVAGAGSVAVPRGPGGTGNRGGGGPGAIWAPRPHRQTAG